MTYLVVSVVVLGILAAATLSTLRRLPAKPLWWTGLVLIALTVVFDNIIVGVGLVDYDPKLILGIRIPVAPVEDLAYTVGAVMLVPALWTWLARWDRSGSRIKDGDS